MRSSIFFFIQPIEEAAKMAKMYLNRFTIDEDADFQILGFEVVSRIINFEHNFYRKRIKAGFERAACHLADNYEPHFIFSGDYESMKDLKRKMKPALREYGIESAKLTIIYMQRKWLYTKEEMDMFYDEKVTLTVFF